MVKGNSIAITAKNIKDIKDIVFENRKIFGHKKPNKNAVQTYFSMYLKRSRFTTLIAYFVHLLRIPVTKIIIEEEKVSVLSSNSATQILMLENISNASVMIVPANIKESNLRSNSKIYKITDLLQPKDFLNAVVEFKYILKDLKKLYFIEKIYIFTCLVEKNCLVRQRISSLYVSYNYGLGSSCSLINGCYQVSGLHGFPVSSYGWLPIWFDEYYVFGPSTVKYFVDQGVDKSILKIRNENRSTLNQKALNFFYNRNKIALIEGGAPGNLNRLIFSAKKMGYKDEQIIVFTHPSARYHSETTFDYTNFVEFQQKERFLCLVENSTGYLNAIKLGCPVAMIKTKLPRLSTTFKTFDNIVVDASHPINFDDLHSYHEQNMNEKEFDAVLKYHWGK